jgi:hypothetical protein
MRARAFPRVQLEKLSFFRRLFAKPLPENGYLELQNLLHERQARDIAPELLTATLDSHGVRTPDRERFKDFYRAAVTAAAEDDILTEEECRELADLRALFGLTDREVNEVQQQVVAERYERRLRHAARDSFLSDQEKEDLDALRQRLKIDKFEIERVRRAVLGPVLTDALERAFKDRRYSPEEERQLALLADNFDVDLELSADARGLSHRFRWLWEVEHGTPPACPVAISLQRNESCHFHSYATSLTTKSVTRRINYHGPTVRIRIMKGVYYRAGSIAVQPVRYEQEVTEGGNLYITNKRVIFMGDRKNQTVRLASLLGFVPYKDGLELEKTSGRNPVFRLQDVEGACAVLSRVLADV